MVGFETLYRNRYLKKAGSDQQMEEQKNSSLEIIHVPDNRYPAKREYPTELVPTGNEVVSALAQFERYKRGELVNNPDQEEEDISRIEFILYKSYWICNAKFKGVWRHCSYPASTTVGEFLLSGSMANVKDWSYGRKENNL